MQETVKLYLGGNFFYGGYLEVFFLQHTIHYALNKQGADVGTLF
jgi:hypothetical protein